MSKNIRKTLINAKAATIVHRNASWIAVLALSAPAWSADPVPSWHPAGDNAGYVCGGISAEGMAALQKQKGDSNAEFLFTEGPERAWVSGVSVTIRGNGLQQPLQFTSDGPSCLLRLPTGEYTVQASYKDMPRSQRVKVGGASSQTVFNWPAK
ncbi:hypothetical protein ACDA63_00150 [Uliginosibacterium sp. sgz301328]|uniref:hypothetical protein n=1 Tax=Uliginosibacterium sp. sgz301328 TaxID=3243764 RepID=UPI00359D99E9